MADTKAATSRRTQKLLRWVIFEHFLDGLPDFLAGLVHVLCHISVGILTKRINGGRSPKLLIISTFHRDQECALFDLPDLIRTSCARAPGSGLGNGSLVKARRDRSTIRYVDVGIPGGASQPFQS